MGRTPADLLGQKFGRLVVDSKAGSDRGGSIWNCTCDCGATTTAYSHHLTQGRTQSCGCQKRENAITDLAAVNTKHGMYGSPEYMSWSAMKSRCGNPNHEGFRYYGGRGVGVCERWDNSFEAFYADMGPRPSLEHTLDRFPNKDGNYEPGNCRWATWDEQSNNRNNNVCYEYNGQTFTKAQLARELNITIDVLNTRLKNSSTLNGLVVPLS